MSKKTPRPAAWKNTYFWIAAILLGLSGFGFVAGQDVIRDPGQTDENGLPWIYLGGFVVMLINGFLSHRQTVQHYEEEQAQA